MRSRTNKILKFIIIYSVLMIPFAGIAQKMDSPQIDKFTGDTTFLTVREIVSKKDVDGYRQQLEVYFSKTRGVITMHLLPALPTANFKRYYILAGSQVLLKLGDNSLISLTNQADLRSETGQISGFLGQGVSVWTTELLFSDAGLQELSSLSPVTAIRVQTDRGNMDFDINRSDGYKILVMYSFTSKAH